MTGKRRGFALVSRLSASRKRAYGWQHPRRRGRGRPTAACHAGEQVILEQWTRVGVMARASRAHESFPKRSSVGRRWRRSRRRRAKPFGGARRSRVGGESGEEFEMLPWARRGGEEHRAGAHGHERGGRDGRRRGDGRPRYGGACAAADTAAAEKAPIGEATRVAATPVRGRRERPLAAHAFRGSTSQGREISARRRKTFVRLDRPARSPPTARDRVRAHICAAQRSAAGGPARAPPPRAAHPRVTRSVTPRARAPRRVTRHRQISPHTPANPRPPPPASTLRPWARDGQPRWPAHISPPRCFEIPLLPARPASTPRLLLATPPLRVAQPPLPTRPRQPASPPAAVRIQRTHSLLS